MRIFLVYFFVLLFIFADGQTIGDARTLNFPRHREMVTKMPDQDHLWIFILAGQSNMAGRGLVEPADTIAHPRILSMDKNNQWTLAKEPLHFYEPTLTGLDCGLSFAQTLLAEIPADISIGILPCAIGGSSVEQWLGDSLYRGVYLFSNLSEKVRLAREAGVIKGILWHQGESNANPRGLPLHEERLTRLFSLFRDVVGNDSLPILVGPLGTYTEPLERQMQWDNLNQILTTFAQNQLHTGIINTSDLTEKGDKVHFDSKSQRTMGERFAREMLRLLNYH